MTDSQAKIDSLWDFDDVGASEARFRLAAEGAGSDLERAALLTQVARALGLAGRFDEARALLDGLGADSPELRVRTLLERGRLLNSSGDAAAARPLFETAFAAATEAGLESLAIDALHMVAIATPDSAEQEMLTRRALDLASSATDPRARQWRAALLNNLGWTLFDRGSLDEALAVFEEAVAERATQGRQPELLIARWCVARTLRELGRGPEALAIQLALAEAHRAAGTSDRYVDEELALLQASTTPEPGSA